jgi:hypothetical protein
MSLQSDLIKRKPLTNTASFKLEVHKKQNIIIRKTIRQHRRLRKRNFVIFNQLSKQNRKET